MRRPLSPKIKEPKKVYQGSYNLYFNTIGSKDFLLLSEINTAWIKIRDEALAAGSRVVNEPRFVSTASSYYAYGSSNRNADYSKMEYVIEWDNPDYAKELETYSKAWAIFEEENSKFEEQEQYIATAPPNDTRAIDLKIEKTKQRLANLEAARDDRPIPYP